MLRPHFLSRAAVLPKRIMRFSGNQAVKSCLLIFCCSLVLLLPGAALSQVKGPQSPLSLVHLIATLNARMAGLPTTNKSLIKQMIDNGVGFEIDEQSEKSLRSAGATDELVKAVRELLCDLRVKLAAECDAKDWPCQIG